MDDDQVAARLRYLLEHASTKRRAVIVAGIQRLAIHPRQTLGTSDYVELCPAYLLTMVDACYETARQAWRQLRQAVGWWSVPWQRIEAMGGRLRPLTRSQRHGQHLLLPEGITESVRQLAAELGIVSHTSDEALNWVDIEPRRRGINWVACCPFHDDRRPSMLLDPSRRRATCLACGTTHRLDPTRWQVSGPVDSVGRSGVPSPDTTTGTIEYRVPGAWVVGAIGLRGLSCAAWPDLDLFGVLLRADAKASRARLPVMAGHRDDAKREAPDLLAHLDEVEPVGWRQRRGRWKPSGHRAVSIRQILVDVDGLEWCPFDRGESLADAGLEIEAWARSRPEFSGRVALIHTSLLGVQAVIELAEPRPPDWRRTPESAAVHDAADATVLGAIRAAGYGGGHADPTARQSGRLIRRPGPRLDKRGQPWIARLRHITVE